MTPRRAAIAGAVSAALLLAGVALLVVRDEEGTQQVTSSGSSVPTTVAQATTSVLPAAVAPPPSTTTPVPATTSTSEPRATTVPARPPTSAAPTSRPGGQQLETAAGGHGPVAAALADARARWARSKPANGYTWAYSNDCFCYPRKLEVTVDGAGRVLGTRNLDEPAAAMTTQGRTVDAAFDELQRAVDGDAATIKVRFDPGLGFPSSYHVDRSQRLADEEHGLTVTTFTPRS